MFPFNQSQVQSAFAAAIALMASFPVVAMPPAKACTIQVAGCEVHPQRVSPGHRQRQIQVILPNRSTVLVSVRPGQDDRAAAFEYLLKRPATTIAEANALQHAHRVTGIWRQGSNGIDIVEFQPW